MKRRPVFDFYTDPSLEGDDDDQESEPWPAEALVIAHGIVSWSLIDDTEND